MTFIIMHFKETCLKCFNGVLINFNFIPSHSDPMPLFEMGEYKGFTVLNER